MMLAVKGPWMSRAELDVKGEEEAMSGPVNVYLEVKLTILLSNSANEPVGVGVFLGLEPHLQISRRVINKVARCIAEEEKQFGVEWRNGPAETIYKRIGEFLALIFPSIEEKAWSQELDNETYLGVKWFLTWLHNSYLKWVAQHPRTGIIDPAYIYLFSHVGEYGTYAYVGSTSAPLESRLLLHYLACFRSEDEKDLFRVYVDGIPGKFDDMYLQLIGYSEGCDTWELQRTNVMRRLKRYRAEKRKSVRRTSVEQEKEDDIERKQEKKEDDDVMERRLRKCWNEQQAIWRVPETCCLNIDGVIAPLRRQFKENDYYGNIIEQQNRYLGRWPFFQTNYSAEEENRARGTRMRYGFRVLFGQIVLPESKEKDDKDEEEKAAMNEHDRKRNRRLNRGF